MSTTFEEAKLCPKCKHPGEDAKTESAPRSLPAGTTVHHIYCRNEVCPWLNTSWLVQVNADGSVPPAKDHRGEPKVYQGFEDHDRMAAEVQAALMAQREREIDPSRREIRNPRTSR